MDKILYNKRGITLIALVITIVVLIILAAVAINLSLGNNGIFNRAKTAKEQYSNAQEDEKTRIAKYSNGIEGYIAGNRDDIVDQLLQKINDLENDINKKNSYKVSGKYTLTTKNNTMTYGTISNLQDNTEMLIDNYKFVAPVDGYYLASWQLPEAPDQTPITYHCTYLYKNGVVIGGSDRQDNSTNIRVPINETSMLKLSAGDKVWLGIYMAYTGQNATKEGTASFALIK